MNNGRRTGAPPQAPQVQLKSLRYGAHHEHVLRRLGGALVLQWDALPDELQDLIVDQAAIVDDREDAPHTAGEIENFIRDAKTIALKALPKAD